MTARPGTTPKGGPLPASWLAGKQVLIWTWIVIVVASGLGIYWTVRGVEGNSIVDRGTGVISNPVQRCNGRIGYRRTVCTLDVTLKLDSGGTYTLDDVNALFNRAINSPGASFSVDRVYIDTTNGQVDKLEIAGTNYQVEPTRHSFLALGIVMLVVDASALAFLVMVIRARSAR